MWTTNFFEDSKVWVHTFDNGYKVITDLREHENRLLNSNDKVVKITRFTEDYTLDDHMRYLTTIDDLHGEGAKVSEKEYGDNMLEE